MKPNTYPQPPPFTWEKVELRDALPVYPPPEPLELPPLPSAPRKPAFDVPYTLTTHLFPACHLRNTRPAPVPKPPPLNASKEERRRIIEATALELDALRTSKVTDGYPRVFWNCVNRYVKNGLDASNSTGVTLFFAHANGFPKETWEPTLSHLLSLPIANIVDEVWLWESVQHGDAGLVNATSASALFDWQDNARDIANFFLHYLPKCTTTSQLPTHLPRVQGEETETRLKHGFSDRQLVAIGHSYGGATSTLAASFFPTLFSSLILIDPVIVQPHDRVKQKKTRGYVTGALGRRDTWFSREEALETFQRNPFFGVWDPAVLKTYVECGLYLTPDESGTQVVKLKMPGIQEAVVFAEVHTEYETFDRISRLDERIPIRWIMPGRPGAPELGLPGATLRKVWVRPKNATNTTIFGGAHLIPQEAPQELAEDLNEYLLDQFSSTVPSRLRASL